MLLVKAPVALTAPSVVLLSAVVGLSEVLQTTPCWVGLGTPRSVTLPLPVAVVVVMSVTAWVVTVGCNQSCEGDILAIGRAGSIGSIGAHVIERAGVRPVMVLVKAPVALTAPSVVLLSAVVGLSAKAPDHTVFGRVGHAQSGDVAVAGGGGGRNGGDSLGGHGRSELVVKVTSLP